MPVEREAPPAPQEAIGTEVVEELERLIPDTRGWSVGHVYEHDGEERRTLTLGVNARMNSGRHVYATARWVLIIEDRRAQHKTEIWHSRGTIAGILLALGRSS